MRFFLPLLNRRRRLHGTFPTGATVALIFLSACLFPSWGISQGTRNHTQLSLEQFRILSDSITLPTFVPESAADRDLGIQEIMSSAEDYDPFTLTLFSGYYFTDNANLSEIEARQDNIFWAYAGLTYLPMIKGNLYGEITVKEQWYIYNSNSNLDFHSFDGGAGLVYVIRPLGDTSTFLRYNYTNTDNYHEISGATTGLNDGYNNHSLQFGFYKPWTLSRHHFLYLSYLSDFSLDGTPGYALRDEHGLVIAYRYHPVRKITADLFYRVTFLDFAQDGREDWNNATGAAVSYHITRNIYLAATAAYNDNSSNTMNADYNVWTTGIRLGGIFQF